MESVFVGGIDWTAVDVDGGNRKPTKANEKSLKIYMSKGRYGNPKADYLIASGALAAAVGWKHGDKLRLYRHGAMMMLKKDDTSMATIEVKAKPKSKSFIIGNPEVARTVHGALKASEFDVKDEHGAVVFFAREQR